MTMKIIAAVPVALLTLGVFGCSQHASTAPAVDRPAATTTASSETNTFGESKDEAAGSAASARDANYGKDTPPAADSASAPAADSTPPK